MIYKNFLLPLHQDAQIEQARIESHWFNSNSSSWDKIQRFSNHQQFILNEVNRFADYWYPLLAQRKKQMAKKAVVSGQFDGFTLVNIDLTDAEKKVFKAWLAEHTAETDGLLAELMHLGYKFSVKYSQSQEMYYGTITSESEDNEDYRCSVTSHAKNWFTSLMLSYYKWDKLSKRVIVKRAVAKDDDIG